MTVWSLLEECISQLDEPFRRSEIIGWFRRHHPEVNEATLAAHIQAAATNAANRAQNNPLGTRRPLLRRVEHGLYARAGQPGEPAIDDDHDAQLRAGRPEPGRRCGADVILIGCVRTKKAAAAAASELFASPLFAGRRRYAAGSGRPWYILSAKFGLLAPGDVIGPYDVYLAAQSPGYRTAWGEFVAAQLEQHEHGLRGCRIEVHAGAAYVDPLRGPLAARGAMLAVPLAHLRQGEQLAWYGGHRAGDAPGIRAPGPLPGGAGEASAAELARLLSDPSRALSPQELRAGGQHDLMVPGLYSWWVDDQGAADLSRGLGLPVPGGLIYAGQAGATRWPSGTRSQGTLWGRITGMHLGGAAEFSTFRRTLAAILHPVLGLDTEDDPKLSAWISTRLGVNAVPVPDPDRLAEAETAVLDLLDPPLNLRGRPPTVIRARLAELRRSHTTDPSGRAAPVPPAQGQQPDDSDPERELLTVSHRSALRQKRAVAPSAALHKYTGLAACPLGRSQDCRWCEELLITTRRPAVLGDSPVAGCGRPPPRITEVICAWDGCACAVSGGRSEAVSGRRGGCGRSLAGPAVGRLLYAWGNLRQHGRQRDERAQGAVVER